MSLEYQISVLSHTPAIYLRLDRVGIANNGDEITDISGNDLHATLAYGGTSPAPCYGLPSPIETDADSREFFCHNDPLVSAATISRASDSLIEFSGDFTIEGWFRSNTVAIAMLRKLKLFDGICYTVEIDGGGGLLGSVRDNGGNVYTVTAPGNVIDGRSRYVVVRRISNVLAISVDSTLRAQTTITSGLPTLDEAGDFQISAGISGDFNYRVDEVALYNYALSDTEIIEHWNAARVALNLHSYSDGRSTAVLSSEIARPRLGFPFQHNLNVDIRETLEYLTPTITGFDVTEQRMSVRTNPRRTLEYTVSPYGDGKIRRLLHSTLFKGQVGPYRLPIFADGSVVENVGISDTVFSVDVDARDYDVGGEVRLWQDESTFEYCTVTDLSPFTISPTVNAYSRAIIEPVRSSYLNGDGDIESVQTSLENVRLLFDVDTREISTNRFTEFTPSLEYNGLEVFNLYQTRLDFQEIDRQQLHRFEDRFDYQSGPVATVPRIATDSFILPLTLVITDRARYGELLGWFKYRAGRRLPLWVPSFQRDFKVTEKPTSSGDTTFSIEYMGYAENYAQNEARRDVAFIKSDGTIICRRITASVDNEDGTETLTIDTNLGAEYNTDFDRVSFLFPARLDHDRLELVYKNWSRGGAVEAVIKFATFAHG